MDSKVPIHCGSCGKVMMISKSTVRRRGPTHHWTCHKCVMNNMSPEKRNQRSKNIKKSLSKLGPERKAEMSRSRLRKQTPEFKTMVKRKQQETWRSKSREELNKISKKASTNTTAVWQNMNPEVRSERLDRLHIAQKQWWNSLTPEELNEIRRVSSKRSKEYWNKSSDDLRSMYGNLSKRFWESLSDEDRKSFVHKWVQQSEPSKFSVKFASLIRPLLTDGYYCTTEFSETNNGVTHKWDYAIFKNGKLDTLIDLDGKYYHADECDYDGIHSNQKYDASRWKSIPMCVKCCIIYENKLYDSIEYLKRILYMDHSEYVEFVFKWCRTLPSITPRYTDRELVKSYMTLAGCDELCSDHNRAGDRILNHFHPSIWKDIEDGWYDDYWLENVIRSNQIYHNYLNVNKLLIGFRRDIVSMPFIRNVIHDNINSDSIFDPKGNPEVILAIISSKKEYYGPLDNEDINMVEFIRKYGFDVKINYDKYDSILTVIDRESEIDIIMDRYPSDQYVFIRRDNTVLIYPEKG